MKSSWGFFFSTKKSLTDGFCKFCYFLLQLYYFLEVSMLQFCQGKQQKIILYQSVNKMYKFVQTVYSSCYFQIFTGGCFICGCCIPDLTGYPFFGHQLLQCKIPLVLQLRGRRGVFGLATIFVRSSQSILFRCFFQTFRNYISRTFLGEVLVTFLVLTLFAVAGVVNTVRIHRFINTVYSPHKYLCCYIMVLISSIEYA